MHSLDESQQRIIQREIERQMTRTNDIITKEVDSILNDMPSMNRQVMSCVKLIVSDWPISGVRSSNKITSCNFTIWDPSEELMEKLREGM